MLTSSFEPGCEKGRSRPDRLAAPLNQIFHPPLLSSNFPFFPTTTRP